jgi:imidazole glycerol-phosphate synthase subunit HisH
MVAIIDYEAGNIGSISNMLKQIGISSVITSSPEVIDQSAVIVLPGVGAFDYGMSKLKELGLIDLLTKKALVEKIPVLGICLGAQLMCKSSEEGRLPGLGWIDAEVKKFPTQLNGNRYRVPHMGWDFVTKAKDSDILKNLPEPSRFYFVHSYYIRCHLPEDKLLTNHYALDYDSAFERDNIVGVQFHPEKSHNFGKQLLKNFMVCHPEAVKIGQ